MLNLIVLLLHCCLLFSFTDSQEVFQQDPVPNPFKITDRYPNRDEFEECRPIKLQLERTSARFATTIVQNNNDNIDFANDDASLMTPRLKSRLDILAGLYKDMFGRKLKVLLAYAEADNPDVATNDSLHFEGRTARITGSGNGQLPEILQLAVQAGFDWVFYADEGYCRVSVIPDVCQTNLDLMFLLDQSGSVGQSNHELALQFMESVVNFYNISSEGTRVSVITFSTGAQIEFNFDDYNSKQQVTRAIRSIYYKGGWTHTALALNLAAGAFNNPSISGARPLSAGIPRVAILITDGHSNAYSIQHPAMRLQAAGATVYSIGVGNYYLPELQFIASNPDSGHVFLLQSFTDAAFFTQLLRGTTCDSPAAVTAGNETETEVMQDEFKYFQLDCPMFADNVVIELTIISGQCAIYGSTTIVNPSPVNYVGITLRNEDNVPVGSVKTLIVPTKGARVLHISIRGISPSTNVFRFLVYNQLFASPSYSTSVPSNNDNSGNPIIVLDILAVDIQYIFTITDGDDTGNFAIDNNGRMTLNNPLDATIQDTYNLTVTASSVNYSCQCDMTTVEVSVIPPECHRSGSCTDSSITIQASSVSECCRKGGKSFDDGTGCITACGMIEGDPHFSIPLLSKDILCYSIQGYSGLAFNLIYNKNFYINALFVDTEGDTTEATWIGKLAVVPQNTDKSETVVFDSVNQKVETIGFGNLQAQLVKTIIFTENGTVKFTQTVQKQNGYPTIHVLYTKPQAEFDVTFYNSHLDVEWNMNYDEVLDSHGLMGFTAQVLKVYRTPGPTACLKMLHEKLVKGEKTMSRLDPAANRFMLEYLQESAGRSGQFMMKDIYIDTKKEMLVYSDGRDPVPVSRDSAMTGKWCWKANNYGHQGEGLIVGGILDYVVPNVLASPDNLKNFM